LPKNHRSIANGVISVAALILCFGAGLALGASRQTLLIVDSPTDGYLVDGTVIKVHVSPATVIPTSVEFFVNDARICQILTPPFQCTYRGGSTASAGEVTIVAYLPGGSQVRAQVSTVGISASTSTHRVLRSVIVSDKDGKFIPGLKAPQFRAFEDGVEQHIDDVWAESPDLHVAVLLDVSQSMAPSMGALKAAVEALVGQIEKTTRVSLVVFNEKMAALTRDAIDHRGLASLLDPVRAEGGTAVYDTLISVLGIFGPDLSNKALVVFTDGDDSRSRATLQDVQNAYARSDVVAYAVSRRAKKGPTRDLLDGLTRQTGGRWFDIDSVRELGATLKTYLLSYEPTAPPDGLVHQVRIEVVGVKDARVQALTSYTATIR
jgi:VWFA-related protein